MARIRTIKPEFWSDEKLSECSLSARLLFIGLISFADDEGRLEYSPQRIRMQVFPCGTVKLGALIDCIGELRDCSLIRLYTVESREFLDIPGFGKHQRINRPTPSKLPAFSVTAQPPLTESSLTPTAGGEGKGRELERNGREREGSLARPGRSPPRKRCPEDFEITPDLHAWAKLKAPDVDVNRETERFRDWEFKTGRSDWPATWRTWMSRAQETVANRPTYGGRVTSLSRPAKSADELEREAASAAG